MFNMPHTEIQPHVIGSWFFFFFLPFRFPGRSIPHPVCAFIPLDKRSRKASMSYTEKVPTSNDHNCYHD